MDYQYIAYTTDKRVLRGTQSAASADMAAKMLASHGYKILSLQPISGFLPHWEQLMPYLSQIKPEAIILLSRQLAILIESGTDLVTSLDLLRQQVTNRRLQTILGEVVADLRRGERFSHTLSKHPSVFPKIYVQSIAVGEQVGGVEAILNELADYMQKELAAEKEVKNALRYPAMVAAVAVVVVIILTIYVLPAFVTLYDQLDVELPVITRAVFAFVAWFSKYGLYCIGALLLVLLGSFIYGRTPEGRMYLDRLALRLPVMGRIIHLTELARCCRSMAILHRSGLPVSEIMGLVVEASNNQVIKNALTRVHQDVLKGQGLSKPMAKSDLFLPMMVQMVAVGEATGSLEATLTSTAQSYETEVEDRMHSAIEYIQPAVTVILAVVVALIASALFSAMYSIYGQFGA